MERCPAIRVEAVQPTRTERRLGRTGTNTKNFFITIIVTALVDCNNILMRNLQHIVVHADYALQIQEIYFNVINRAVNFSQKVFSVGPTRCT